MTSPDLDALRTSLAAAYDADGDTVILGRGEAVGREAGRQLIRGPLGDLER